MKTGPDRVIVHDDGTAFSPRQALERYGTAPDVVFVRSDGWFLGAPRDLEWVAYEMWEDHWIGYFRTASEKIRPISEYSGKRRAKAFLAEGYMKRR